jgi:hypothetical protein
MAFTGQRDPGAGASGTLISNGTGIIVVAGFLIGGEVAATGFGADVIGTWIVIGTFYRSAKTSPGFTMVSQSAGIAIIAGTFIQDLVHAPFAGHALVFGAIVAVIAQIDIVPFYQVRFIGLAIAVVVDTVTGFRSGNTGITSG